MKMTSSIGMAAFLVLAGLVAVFSTVFSHTAMKAAYMNWAYFLTIFLVGLWGATLCRFTGSTWGISQTLKQYRWGWLGCGVVVGLVFLSVPVGFKVLSDEANLVSVAQQMFRNHSGGQPIIDYVYYQAHHPMRVDVPIRPLVFPFFVSLVYGVVGDGVLAAFAVNALCLFLFLCLVYVVVSKALEQVSGFAAVLFVVSQPVLTTTAASAGFDLLALLLLGVGVWLFWEQIRNPRSEVQALLWSTLLLFANVRYEASIICVVLVLGLVLAKRWLWSDLKDNPIPYAATLLVMLPMAWQRVLTLTKMEAPKGELLFDLRRIVPHGGEFIEALFRFDFVYPYNNLANLLGIALALFLGWWWYRKGRFSSESHERIALYTILIIIVGMTVLYLIHDKGKVSFPTSARFFLMPMLTMSLMPIVARRFFPERVSANLLVGLGLVFVLLYHPVACKNEFMNRLNLIRRTTAMMEFLDENLPSDGLVVSDRPIHYVALGYGSIGFNDLKADVKGVLRHLRCGSIPKAIIAQRLANKGEVVVNRNDLPAEIPIKLLGEKRVQNTEFLRFYEIEGGVSPPGSRDCP